MAIHSSSVKILTLLATVITRALANTHIILPALPYALDGLEPAISKDTLVFHHGKHHNKYVETTSQMIQGTKYSAMNLKEIVLQSYKDEDHPGLFNNAAQSWNHEYYWKCMTPGGGGIPSETGLLMSKIKESFNTFAEFKKEFTAAGMGAFGSGWAWLVYNQKEQKLVVTKTTGADNPMTTPGMVPILCMDVWEHAYYLDYKNDRQKYIETFMEKLVNWQYVEDELHKAIREPHREL